MFFNSIGYATFLPIVFLIYWFAFGRSVRWQNLWIIAASYFFYACWDWRFLFLIVLSSAVDYYAGLAMGERPRWRRICLLISIFTNLGILAVFKYYNFFIDSLLHLNPGLQHVLGHTTLNIVLPVGISFYTFQTLSYTIDVYNRKVEPVRDIFAFFAFVSFFPQLVAGPIERATHLLPQFCQPRKFHYGGAVDGMRQILWGVLKKVVIADNAAFYVNDIFSHWSGYSGSTLLLGTVLFAVQIYGDFSGYSDIAIGSARLFGIDLMRNFAFPYFSRDIAEFWRRWHISLSTWFRDYVYIPLGGSRGHAWKTVRNVFIIFLVSGLWHGANWTFVVWGLIHALFFLPLILMKKHRQHTDIPAQGRLFPSLKEFFQMAVTFFITSIAWIFFRAESLAHAVGYMGRVFSASLFSKPDVFPVHLMAGIGLFCLAEWLQRDKQHALQIEHVRIPGYARWSVYAGLIFIIGTTMATEETPFIYFQF